MGIDIYLSWKGMTKKEKQAQVCGFSVVHGHAGYLREAYHGGPYATKILVREAFESKTCKAKIPAVIMQERLWNVTEPARNVEGGDMIAQAVAAAMRELKETGKLANFATMFPEGMRLEMPSRPPASSLTEPMSVIEAIKERQKLRYPKDDPEMVEKIIQSFRDFVALAARKEAKTGRPCTVYASY